MTASTVTHHRTGTSAITTAAWAMIAGALLQAVLGIPLASLQAEQPPLWQIAAANAFSHLLLIAGIAGLAASRVAGRGRLALVGVMLTQLGLVLLSVAELIWATAGEDAAVPFYSGGTLALMVGLIVLGVGVLRTGRWRGWQRFSVLATGLFIPLILLPAFTLPGYAPNYAIGAWGICWLLVGLALWQYRQFSRAHDGHETDDDLPGRSQTMRHAAGRSL